MLPPPAKKNKEIDRQ